MKFGFLLGIPEIDTGFMSSESDVETESSDEEEAPVNSRKRKMSPVTRSIPKKSRGN